MAVFISASPFAKLLRPLSKGSKLTRGFSIHSVEDEGDRLGIEISNDSERFVMNLYPESSDVPFWQRTKTSKISINSTSPPSNDAMFVARMILSLILRNEQNLKSSPWIQQPPVLGDVERLKEVDLRISTACQNNCVFCTDMPHHLRFVPSDEIRDRIRNLAKEGVSVLSFTSLEPTLRKDIVELVEFASKVAKIPEVRMVTNCARTHDLEFLESLIDAGLTRLTVSVHSNSNELETKITGNQNSFDEKLATLQNLKHLRSNGKKVEFFTNTVIHKTNLANLADTARFLSKFEPDEMDFYFVYPHGAALANFFEVVPRLTEMKPHLERLIRTAEEIESPIMLLDIPLCILPRNIVSLFRHKRKTIAPIGTKAFIMRESDWSGERTKPDSCKGCRLYDACGGVWKKYAELYGTDELTPILANDANEHRRQ